MMMTSRSPEREAGPYEAHRRIVPLSPLLPLPDLADIGTTEETDDCVKSCQIFVDYILFRSAADQSG